MTITDEQITNAIIRCGTNFDSHDIIECIRNYFSIDYANELKLIGKTSGNNYQTLHSKLGKQIYKLCTSYGFESTAESSKNIFGEWSSCTRYNLVE